MLGSLIAVFIGGGFGSVLRWLVSMKLNPISLSLPFGTLIVNLLGSFIIGCAVALFLRFNHIDAAWKLLITTGFCGGLTTFSTFSLETCYLLQDGRLLWALTNIMLNLLGSLAMTLVAFGCINWLTNQ